MYICIYTYIHTYIYIYTYIDIYKAAGSSRGEGEQGATWLRRTSPRTFGVIYVVVNEKEMVCQILTK